MKWQRNIPKKAPEKVKYVYLMNKTHKNKLYEFIKENHYDLVVTTHLFPALTLTAINEDKTLDKINESKQNLIEEKTEL